MKKLNLIVMLTAGLLSLTFSSCTAQIKNVKTQTVNISGNCGSCKKNIETAAFKKKVSSAVWDKDAKTAVLTFDSAQITVDAILKNIALAGYDNQNYLAPESAYTKLDMCCQYDRKKIFAECKTTRW